MYQTGQAWAYFNANWPIDHKAIYAPSRCAGCRELGVPRIYNGYSAHCWPIKWPDNSESFPSYLDMNKWEWKACTAAQPHEECVALYLAQKVK